MSPIIKGETYLSGWNITVRMISLLKGSYSPLEFSSAFGKYENCHCVTRGKLKCLFREKRSFQKLRGRCYVEADTYYEE